MDLQMYHAPFPSSIQTGWQDFLLCAGLRDEGGAERLALLTDGEDRILACGALSGRVLRQIAVLPELQGQDACAQIVSALMAEAYSLDRTHLFLCTKPLYQRLFASLGFFPLAETADALFLENTRSGLDRYLSGLSRPETEPAGPVGAVVCNCNPFTLGHQWLIRQAAGQCGAVHVFVLSDPAAAFSPEERLAMVAAGTADLPNCFVHPGGDYLISRATFPTYFIKDAARAEDVRADLDLTLFGRRIAPGLGITVRFVGTEPFCPVTRAYNARMEQLLPGMGVAVRELERYRAVSASRVRTLMEQNDLAAIRRLVPDTTYAAILRHLS